jgi:prepilin peptidase CpaA
MPLLLHATVVLFLTACVVWDLGARRIPNVLSLSAAVVGLTLNGFYFGVAGLGHSLLGVSLMVALLLAPFAAGGIGAGDVKMMGAVGALLGPTLALAALLAGMLMGGVIAALHLMRLGLLLERLQVIRDALVAAVLARSVEPLRMSSAAANAITLPYGVPLALGTLATMIAAALGSHAS